MKIQSTIALLSLLIVAASPVDAAQQATSFEQLQVLVDLGDTVTVTDSAGNTSRGKILEISPSELRMTVDGMAKSWAHADVLEIKQRRADSLGNGAIIGTIVSGALGILGAIGCASEGDCTTAEAWGSFAAVTLMGTGAGVAIDALIVKQQTIYRPRQTASTRFRISPLISRNDRGVAVKLSF